VAHYSEEAGKLATIKIPMRGFKKFTGLAYSLPDDPGVLVSVKRGLIKMNTDTTKFLDQLDQMDAAMDQQKSAQSARQQKLEGDAKTLDQTNQNANESKSSFQQANDTTGQLDSDNKARKDEAAKMKNEAAQDAQGLQKDAEQKKAKAQSMAAALDSWAQNHRKARLDALEQTKKNLEARGYKITEVKEL
jgi:hypothetical protein